MKSTLCMISVLLILSSCKTVQIITPVNSATAQGFPKYTLTILISDAGVASENTMSQVYESLGSAQILQADCSGSCDGNKKIRIKLELPEDMMAWLYIRIYAIPNIISVEIN